MNLLIGEISQAGHLSAGELFLVPWRWHYNKHLAFTASLKEDELEFLTDKHFTSQTIKDTQNFHKQKSSAHSLKMHGAFPQSQHISWWLHSHWLSGRISVPHRQFVGKLQ